MTDLTSMPCYSYSIALSTAVGVERRWPSLRRVLLSTPRGCLGRSVLPHICCHHCLHAHHLLPCCLCCCSWFKTHLLPPKISSAVLWYLYWPHWSEQIVSSVSPRGCQCRSLPVLDTQSLVEYSKTPLKCAYPKRVELMDLIALLDESHKNYLLAIWCMLQHHYLLNAHVECSTVQFLNGQCDCSEQPYGVEIIFSQHFFLHYQA